MIPVHAKETIAHALACFCLVVGTIACTGAVVWMGLNFMRRFTG